VPDRDCADAIFYVLRTGCQWQALDQTELCTHSTAHDRFRRLLVRWEKNRKIIWRFSISPVASLLFVLQGSSAWLSD
jgi:transposase